MTVLALILRTAAGAHRAGKVADRLVERLPRRLRPGRALDLTGKILRLRAGVIEVIRTRWAAVIGAALLPQFTSWLILLLALWGLQSGGHVGFRVSWSESLAAFSFAVAASFLPISAGGLGTVDAGITGLLGAFGATANEALAVDLVWRAGAFLPPLATGALAGLSWQSRTGRTHRRASRSP